MAADIREAIARKAANRYGGRTALLIYPNSNAMFADTAGVAERLPTLTQKSSLAFALVLRSTDLIAIDRAAVRTGPAPLSEQEPL